MGEKNNYKTSQLSDIIGFSRDTLRHYEKEGIISPKQNKNNNYRQYGTDDIFSLMVIDFYKKRGFSIKEVKNIQSGCELADLHILLTKKHTEIEQAIRNQQFMLKKIEQTLNFNSTLEQHLNQYSIRECPLFEVNCEFSDFEAFHEYHKALENINPLCDDILSNFIKKFSFNENSILSSNMVVVKENETRQKKTDTEYLDYAKCMYTIIEDAGEANITENVLASIWNWAEKNIVEPIGVAFVRNRIVVYCDNKERQYLEIFIPIK